MKVRTPVEDAADEVVQLINAQAKTPTADEIAGAIRRRIDNVHAHRCFQHRTNVVGHHIGSEVVISYDCQWCGAHHDDAMPHIAGGDGRKVDLGTIYGSEPWGKLYCPVP